MTHNRLWRSWLLSLALTAITVPFCIAYIDRPIASYSVRHINESGLVPILRWFVFPLGPIVVLSLIIVVLAALRVISGGDVPRWVRPMLVPTIAVTMGFGVEMMLKEICGRSDILPTYTKYHDYGWDFFDPRDGWRSFPSGTAIALFAFVGVLAVRRSQWTQPALIVSLAVCALITVIPFHWLSDVIAGMFIGLTMGYATATLLSQIDSTRQ